MQTIKVNNGDDEWPSDEVLEVLVSVEVPRGMTADEILEAIERALCGAERCWSDPDGPKIPQLYVTAKNVIHGSLAT